MWPRKQFLLRIGRHECLLWHKQGRQWQCLGKHVLQAEEPQPPYVAIGDGIAQLAQHLKAGVRLLVVVDSHWMPAMLVDTGPAPLGSEQIQALAAHRFAEARGEAARQWSFMSDYIAGDRRTLVFACPPQLQQVITDSVAKHVSPKALKGLQPTLNWSMAQAPSNAVDAADVCTVLHEQDRSLMVFASKGKLQGFHPAAATLNEPQQLVRDIPLHAWRCGASAPEWTTHVLAFDPPPNKQAIGIQQAHAFCWTTLATTEINA